MDAPFEVRESSAYFNGKEQQGYLNLKPLVRSPFASLSIAEGQCNIERVSEPVTFSIAFMKGIERTGYVSGCREGESSRITSFSSPSSIICAHPALSLKLSRT